MDKSAKRILALFIVVLVGIPIVFGLSYLTNYTSERNTNVIHSEDLQVTQDKETLSNNLKDQANIQSESDDPSSVLVVYTNESVLQTLSNLKDEYGNIHDSQAWQDLVVTLTNYSKESPRLTISIVNDVNHPDDAYLVLYNGKVLFNITDLEY